MIGKIINMFFDLRSRTVLIGGGEVMEVGSGEVIIKGYWEGTKC